MTTLRKFIISITIAAVATVAGVSLNQAAPSSSMLADTNVWLIDPDVG
jgi:hypothetical protein